MELKNDFRVGLPAEQAWAVLTDIERIAPCMPGAELYEIEGDEYHGLVKVKVGPITAQYRGKAFFLDKDDEAHRAVLRAEGRDNRGQGHANATITAQLVGDGDGTRVEITTDLAITGKVAQFGRGVLADVSVKLLDQFVNCLETDLLAGVAVSAPASAALTVASADPVGPDVSSGAPMVTSPSGDADARGEEAEVVVAEPEIVDLDSDVVELEPELEPAVEAAEVDAGAPPVEVEPEPEVVALDEVEPEPKEVREPVAAAAPARKVEAKPAQPVDLLGTAGAPVVKRVLPAVAAAAVVVFLVRRWRRR